MGLFVLSRTTHLLTKLPSMVCANISCRTSRKFIILIYMVTYAKIPSYPVPLIMYLVFRLAWVSPLQFVTHKTLHELYTTIACQNIGVKRRNLHFLRKKIAS